MKYSTLLKIALVVAALLVSAYSLPVRVTAEDQTRTSGTLVVKAPTPRLKAFMRKKLVASDQIMEGLTMPDYALIRKGATTMIHMSKEAIWETHGGAVFSQDSVDFVRSAERLIKLANAKDLEGASHTYAQLTVQCVDCHRRERNERIVLIPRESLDLVSLE